MGCTRLIKGWEHDCDQAVEDAVVIGLHGGENPVRKVHRIGLRLGRYRPEILACCPEDVPYRAVAVVDAVEHRLGKVPKRPSSPHLIWQRANAAASLTRIANKPKPYVGRFAPIRRTKPLKHEDR